MGVPAGAIADYNILKDQQLVSHGVMPLIEQGFAGTATGIPPIVYTRPVTRCRAAPFATVGCAALSIRSIMEQVPSAKWY